MLTTTEAERVIWESVPTLPVETCPLASAHGRVLREPLVAERDSPPFDRVTMDGYAVRSGGEAGPRRWRVSAFQPAGAAPLELRESDTALEIATGAVLPIGADSIVPYEDTEREGEYVLLSAGAALVMGQNTHRRATDFSAGQNLIASGQRLGAREIAVAASCGYAQLSVSALPRIAIIATGDELVEVGPTPPLPHQIRRSNDYALAASLASLGYTRIERFHLKDKREALVEMLGRIVAEFHVLVLTGGVSKGKLDLLPSVLEELRVKKRFQGVAQRPGKPFWFGLTPNGGPVFALPGNPVSTYLCFQRYVLGALAKMSGTDPRVAESIPVVLAVPVSFTPKLSYLLPVRIEFSVAGLPRVYPNAFNTSGDFLSLVGTDGFVEFPPGPLNLPEGAEAKFVRWA